MIIKMRDQPYYLMQLQSLERRIPKNHPKKELVNTFRINELTGLQGERKIDFPLGFLCNKNYYILQQLRLKDSYGHFQIDSLILHQNFLLILEVKNWFGNILFGSQGQVTRINEQNEEVGFPNPIQQVKLQKYRLQNWLHNHGISKIPLTYFVVIAQPRTIIKSITPQDKIPTSLIYTDQLLFKINELSDLFTDIQLSHDQLIDLSSLLKKSHIINRENILSKFEICKEELIVGVACPKCDKLPMQWKRYKPWYCIYCHYKSTGAYIDALNDYLLLIDDEVTNKQIRNFLLIDSASSMKYILQKKQYNYYGKTSDRYYKLTLRNSEYQP